MGIFDPGPATVNVLVDYYDYYTDGNGDLLTATTALASYNVRLGTFLAQTLGLGGWAPSILHYYAAPDGLMDYINSNQGWLRQARFTLVTEVPEV